MKIDVVKNVINELRNYNLKETLLYVKYQLNHNEMLYTRQLMERKRIYNRLSTKQQIKLAERIFKQNMGVSVDISHPITFSDKIQWIKRYGICEQMTELADKYLVRKWVADIIGEKYLIPLIGVWDSFEEIDFRTMPHSFCLKTTHGSAMNYPVKDKNEIDFSDLQEKLAAWMLRPFDMVSYEQQYKNIPRRILAEQFIEGMDGKLYDYKFHCVDGNILFIQCIGERDNIHHTAYHDHFDIEWNKLEWNFECFPRFPYSVKKPINLDEMIEVARKLSQGFNYVRVDLYDINGKVYFGEMTFTPGSGMYPYRGTWTYNRDKELGEKISVN